MTKHSENTEPSNSTKPVLDAVFGDSETEILKLDSGSVDVICIDPPYLYLKNQKLEREFDEIEFFEQCKRVLTKDGFIIMFGRGVSFYRWNTILDDLGFTFKEEIVWNKKKGSSPVHPLSRMHETISIFCKGKGKINNIKIPYIEFRESDFESVYKDIKRLKQVLKNDKALDNVIHLIEKNKRKDFLENSKYSKYQTTVSTKAIGERTTICYNSILNGFTEKSIIEVFPNHYKSIHPTEKPVRLLERLLMLCLPDKPKNEILVVDFFAGSFSLGEACYNIGVNFKGYEIDQEYFNGGEKRLKDIQFKTTLF